MNSIKMPCISLWQPWASLVIHGIKDVETRTWAWPNSLLGRVIGIHAAQNRSGLHLSAEAGLMESAERIRPGISQIRLPFGMIVGTVIIEACIPTERLSVDAFGDFSPGRYGWILADPRPFRDPIPAKGHQRIFWSAAAYEAIANS